MSYIILETFKNDVIESFKNEFEFNEYSLHYSSDESFMLIVEKIERCLQQVIKDGKRVSYDCFEEFIETNIMLKVPFVVTSSQLNHLKNESVHLLLESKESQTVVELCFLFDEVLNLVAKHYLTNYTELLKRSNAIRLIKLESLIENSVIVYFEKHVHWLNQLVKAVESSDALLTPQKDSTLCEFGAWLHHEGDKVVDDKTLLSEIHQSHDELHQTSKIISKVLERQKVDYHKLYNYLQKAEVLSLNMGNSIALINNVITNIESTKDPLTGALNRRVLDKILYNQLDIIKVTNTYLSMVLIDIDHFKTINDTYGHVAGDEVLEQFYTLLHSELRSSDFILRYGGEEFLLILPATSKKVVMKLMEKIRIKVMNHQFKTAKNAISITASFGVVSVDATDFDTTNAQTLKRFITAADDNLYLAKRHGRNCIV